nr:WD40 repeat domain-containing protein [Candidatus Parabeggiatoa sp.]
MSNYEGGAWGSYKFVGYQKNAMKTIYCRLKHRVSKGHWTLRTAPLLLLGLSLGSVSAFADTLKATRTFEGHTDSVESVAISNDGKQILSGSYDNTVKMWHIETGEIIHTFKGHTDFVMSVNFSPDSQAVLSGSADNTLKRWNTETGKEVDTFQRNIGWVYSIALSNKTNRAILSGSRDNTPRLWNTLNGSEIDTFQGHTNEVYLVAVSDDASKALSASEEGTLKVWHVETGKEIHTIKDSGHVWSVAFSHDGSQILSGGEKGTVKLFDSESGQEIRSFKGLSGRVYSVAFSPDASRVVSGGHDGTIKVWDINSGNEIHTLKGHTDIVSSVVFSPDGSQILSGSYDNSLKLWQMPTAECSTLSCIHFEGLEEKPYPIGETLKVNLVESGSRSAPFDLWVAIVTPMADWFYMTALPSEPYSLKPQFFKTSVENAVKTHELFSFNVQPEMAGKYIIYAVYVDLGKNPLPIEMGGDGEAVWQSNLAADVITLIDDK